MFILGFMSIIHIKIKRGEGSIMVWILKIVNTGFATFSPFLLPSSFKEKRTAHCRTFQYLYYKHPNLIPRGNISCTVDMVEFCHFSKILIRCFWSHKIAKKGVEVYIIFYLRKLSRFWSQLFSTALVQRIIWPKKVYT